MLEGACGGGWERCCGGGQEGSAAGCCPVSHHVPLIHPTSSCGPGAQGRKLCTGASTAGMLWEGFLCVTLCGEALAHRRPTVI